MSRAHGHRGRRGYGEKPSPKPPRGLFGDILLAPDRDHCPGADPVVSFHEEDEQEFRREVEPRLLRRVHLLRRGVDHGHVAALDPRGLVPPTPKRRELRAPLAWRWHAGRPVFLRGELAELLGPLEGALRERAAERKTLLRGEGLESRVRGAGSLPLADPERDLERVRLPDTQGAFEDLWAKTGRLSTHGGDRSLRLRLAFGAEGSDDDSDDEARHRAVAAQARRIWPEFERIEAAPEPRRLLERFVGGEVLFTQPIAYWNAPQGGARFHHDAFREEPGGQRGVAFCQLFGTTVWLALSLEDLGRRVSEFGELLDGAEELRGLAEELFGSEAAWRELRPLCEAPEELRAELARPGCGRLGALVDRGPEFTGFLADAGHATLLAPGDVLLLPNHGWGGLGRTAMHSVFCGSESQVGFGLSLAVRSSAAPERQSEPPI